MFCDQLFRQKMVFLNQKNIINLQTNLFAFHIFADEAMKSRIDILKGIHPGKIIGRDLKKRNLSQRSFAVPQFVETSLYLCSNPAQTRLRDT